MIYVYALKSLDRNYIHVGQTESVLIRFRQYNDGEEKTTCYYTSITLIFSMECKDRTEAGNYEKFNKSGQGKEILKHRNLC
ncbi:MAG: GIY-YIG nuclease family protein [Bacteroidia bacterium]